MPERHLCRTRKKQIAQDWSPVILELSGLFVAHEVSMRFEDDWSRFVDAKEFHESDVTRNALGEFAKRGTAPVVFGKHEKSKTFREKEHRKKTAEEFYGERLPKNLKGRSAVMYMLQERRGHIPAAFHRDDIGDIDLVWGDTVAGLCHIFEQRQRKKQNVGSVIYGLSTTLANGRIEEERNRFNSVCVRYGKMRVSVALGFKGSQRQAVITAYEVDE